MTTQHIIVIEGDDVTVFRSVDVAVRMIESEDALSDYLEFYAANGMRLTAEADPAQPSGWTLSRMPGSAPMNLRPRLLEYLRGVDSARLATAEMEVSKLLDLIADLQAQGRRNSGSS